MLNIPATTPRASACRWLARPPSLSASIVRLFCFPYAGGDTLSIFGRWMAHAGDTVEIVPVLLPGRGSRVKEPPFESLSQLADALLRGLAPFCDAPFALFGHSMGGLIAFELGLRLEESGKRPACVFVSGCSAPHHFQASAPTYHLPDPEFLEELRRLKGTSEDVFVQTELLTMMLPTIRADFKACQTHVFKPEARLRSPIINFGGSNDDIKKVEIENWQQYTFARHAVYMFPGDHFFIRHQYPDMMKIIHRHLRFELTNRG